MLMFGGIRTKWRGKYFSEQLNLEILDAIIGQINQDIDWQKDMGVSEKPCWRLKAFCTWVDIIFKGWKENFLGFLDIGATCTLVPKLMGPSLTWASVRFNKYRSKRADRIKVEVSKKITVLKPFLCEEVVSVLPKCSVRMDVCGYYVWLWNACSL